MLVDTHCHLADPAYDADRDAVLERAWAAGVAHVVSIGSDPASAAASLALAAAEPRCSVAVGVHPHDADGWGPEAAARLSDQLERPGVVALGEIGFDYHYERSSRAAQRRAFEDQLALAADRALPVVIHARVADDDVATMLEAFPGVRAVLHSFSSGPALLDRALALGHFVSFSGMVTFRNWTLDDAVRRVPADRLLVETDGPYLAPVPHRGRRNEPAFVAATAARVAEVRGTSPAALIASSAAAAVACFGPRLAAPTAA
ncbi:MAG: TatD family hydrolase [Gemmatimonadales bacterium]|nr:TatD family hydrolase [Gemmatimonadales bacterium]